MTVQRSVRSRYEVDRASGGRQLRVSFSGLDGAGKSLQIQELVRALEAQGLEVEVRWLPFKFWPETLKNSVPRRIRRRLHPKGDSPVPTRKDSAPEVERQRRRLRETQEIVRDRASRGLRAGVWAVLATTAGVSTGLSLRNRLSGSNADVLVLDRYRLDSAVKLQYAFPSVSRRWLARIVAGLSPRPDLEVWFRVDPEVAYSRKAEQWTVSQLSTQARLYDELAEASPHVLTIDAVRDPAAIAMEVLAHLRPVLDAR